MLNAFDIDMSINKMWEIFWHSLINYFEIV